jgi:hypothetical protein
MKLTVSQAAERAGVCATIIYGWCAARLFPFYRIGSKGTRGKIFIDETDLATYLESCRVEPASCDLLEPGRTGNSGPCSMAQGQLLEVVPAIPA